MSFIKNGYTPDDTIGNSDLAEENNIDITASLKTTNLILTTKKF